MISSNRKILRSCFLCKFAEQEESLLERDEFLNIFRGDILRLNFPYECTHIKEPPHISFLNSSSTISKRIRKIGR